MKPRKRAKLYVMAPFLKSLGVTGKVGAVTYDKTEGEQWKGYV